MVLTLDPRYPLVWRTPQSLQFGIDVPLVQLDEVSLADERMISALTRGVSRPGLDVIASAAGGTGADAAALVHQLEPLLLREGTPSKCSVIIEGSGSLARQIRENFPGPDAPPDHTTGGPDLAIIVADYVIPPEAHGRWLRQDVPHLPVIVGDSLVRIGPVIEPGIGPCLYCLELHRIDEDPAWRAIATQLLGRRPPLALSTTPLAQAEAAAIVTRVVLARLAKDAGDSPSDSTSIELDIATGERTSRVWERHPDCACADLGAEFRSELSADRPEPVRRENETASAQPAAPIRIGPRTGAAVGARV